MLDAKGQPLEGAAPVNPLKIGRILHACDPVGQCAPMVVTQVHDSQHISGLVLTSQVLRVQEIRYQPNPDVAARIAVPGGQAPTWHWPSACPWNR